MDIWKKHPDKKQEISNGVEKKINSVATNNRQMTRKLIVGIDSGTTKAVALFDINSGYYETYSEKNASTSDLCNFIVSRGSPVLVCTDRRESELAQKIAAAFNARLLNPKKDLSSKDKSYLVREYDYSNNHEKDAIASALHARKRLQKLFSKIESKLARKNLQSISVDVKEAMLRKKANNISHAIEISKKY